MKTNELSQQEMQATNGGLSMMPYTDSRFSPQEQDQGYTSGSAPQTADYGGQGDQSMASTTPGASASDDSRANYIK